MFANTLRTLAGPAAAHGGVDRLDQLAPDLDADERGLRICARPIDQEVRLGGAELDLERAPRCGFDARHVGDLEQVRLERVDVLADPHRQPRSGVP